MNYEDLQTEIINLVDSGTTSIDAAVPALVNEAVRAIANEPGVILRSLKSIVSVNTVLTEAYTSLPDGYSGKLLFASYGGVRIEPHTSIEHLMEDYPDLSETGDVEALVLEDTVLWYAKIPTTVSPITLLLYSFPEALSDDTDVPVCIPEHLHRQTIIPYCAKVMFDLLEQGDDGDKTNTMVHELAYQNGITKLREYIASQRRNMSRSIWNL